MKEKKSSSNKDQKRKSKMVKIVEARNDQIDSSNNNLRPKGENIKGQTKKASKTTFSNT